MAKSNKIFYWLPRILALVYLGYLFIYPFMMEIINLMVKDILKLPVFILSILIRISSPYYILNSLPVIGLLIGLIIAWKNDFIGFVIFGIWALLSNIVMFVVLDSFRNYIFLILQYIIIPLLIAVLFLINWNFKRT
jgi:hypothetical protein